MKSPLIALLALWLSLNSCAGDAPPTPAPAPVTITAAKEAWTLSNEALDLRLAFKDGSLQVVGLVNKAAKRDYLAGRAAQALFTHTVAGQICAANDGKWSLGEVKTTLIEVFGKTWGKRLEITLSRGELLPSRCARSSNSTRAAPCAASLSSRTAPSSRWP